MIARPTDLLHTAEDWYQNDYPDEESETDEDGSGEHSRSQAVSEPRTRILTDCVQTRSTRTLTETR